MKRIIALLFFLSALLLTPISAKAEGYYHYENIDVDIRINQDSTFEVEERQAYFLDGSFGFFYRDIDLKGLDHISGVAVFDSEGNKVLNPEIFYQGDRLNIKWNFPRRDFSKELKAWTVKYTVHGAIGFYEDYDEIYWNAVFADRQVPVKKATVSVYLPAKKSQIEAKMFAGFSGSTKQSYDFEIKDGLVLFSGKDIMPGENLTVAVWWPKGYIQKPFLYRNQLFALSSTALALVLPVLFFIFYFSAWKKKGKDERSGKTIIAQYEPAGIPPAVSGVLLKQKAGLKEILATLIDLAVRGYVKIIESEKGFSAFKRKVYTFQKVKEFDDLRLFEKNILSALFDEETTVSSEELKNKFYLEIPFLERSIYEETALTPYFNGNVQKTRKKYAVKNILILFLSPIAFFTSFLLSGALSLPPIVLVCFVIILGGLILGAVIGLIFSFQMPALTKEGAEAKWKMLGFKEYLNTAERFRIGQEVPETFSKFLPYAMIFGVEKQWAERFSYFEYKEQNWYSQAPMFSASQQKGPRSFGDFSSGISSFSRAMTSVFTSSPKGGSPGGGGGFAGGGAGGGGGGAG